jgi:L-alanine-DL-glutamate epimerase-like enolase superfamily enzyme
MKRREFVKLLAAAALAPRLALAADEAPKDVKIVRIVAFDLPTKRVKFVGKNARLDDHGDHSHDRIVRLITNTGVEGFGVCHRDEKTLRALLDQNPATIKPLTLDGGSAPLWDLLGKLTNKPAYQLLTPLTAGQSESPTAGLPPRAVDSTVAVYDGSIYFSDLLPRYQNNWQDRFKEELDDTLSRGHRALKAKIGRGNKWMPREEGDARDIEVLKVLRAHAGKDVKIAVDANNGYLDVARCARLLDALPDYNFEFLEEMFPEEVEKDLALKAEIKKRNLKTLLADGETQSDVAPLKPLMEAKALDIFQLDINGVGPDGLIEEAALAHPHGGTIAPHSWGTLVGFYAMLHVARAIPNFYSAEQDPLTSDALIAEGYKIENGRCSVPDSPGFGLRLREKSLADIKPVFDLKS